MSNRFTLRYSASTHVGMKRKINEDSILALPDQRVFMVADGMGGHEGGDFASQVVTDSIAVVPPGLEARDFMQAMRRQLEKAHDLIRSEARLRGKETMGATVVTLLLTNGFFVAFWAGDSRLYRFRDGDVEMLTQDHSVVANLVSAGSLTWDEAENHPQSNVITRAVGVGEALELDKIRGDVRSGDRFLLCSDGLTKYATQATLRRLVVGAPIENVADGLVQHANSSGGADNVSVIVVDAD